ncbi:MAG: hypothetical protein NTU57_05910 [Candidatus Aenigmarchaeota archaeon]|nr:hypothetical protein [Candidatus Aenigmarchaeota archaeon]
MADEEVPQLDYNRDLVIPVCEETLRQAATPQGASFLFPLNDHPENIREALMAIGDLGLAEAEVMGYSPHGSSPHDIYVRFLTTEDYSALQANGQLEKVLRIYLNHKLFDIGRFVLTDDLIGSKHVM